MIKILRFAKKYWYIMVLVISLLFVQAWCELSLPEYTSNIVDVGLQYKGIESNVPEVIREEGLEHLSLFLTEEELDELSKDYVLANPSEEENYGNSVYKKNRTHLTNPVYVRNHKAYTKKELKSREVELKNLLSGSEMMNMLLSMEGEEYEQMRTALLGNMGVDASKVDDIFVFFAQLPQEARNQISQGIQEKMSDLADTMGDAMGIAFVQQEYAALGIDIDHIQMSYLQDMGFHMFVLAFLGMAAAISVAFLSSQLAAKTNRDLRNRVFHKVIGFSNSEMNSFSIASLITRSTNDIQQVQHVLMLMFRIVAYAPIMGIGGIVKVVKTNFSMTWIIGIAVLLIFMLVGFLMVVAMPKFKMMQTLVDRLNLVTREILTGIPVIRAFSREKHEEERFEGANRNLTKTQLFTSRTMALMMPTMMFIMNGITILIVWVGANGIDMGNLQVGDMMAFITYTMQIVMSFLMITMISIMLPRAAVAAGRIEEVLNSQTLIENKSDAKELAEVKQGLRFEHVNFRYDNAKEDVLEDIDFEAEIGKTTAIIGSTGCGKSTLVNLIPRLYDVTGGKITIDGVDIRDLEMHSLRNRIGFVPQKGILFSGTIASNINFGLDEENEEVMREAARIAQATEFIESKEEKYASSIAQGGNNVSGGQKQRLAIARAIAKNPDIYVFDDSFSALDYKTDVALRKELKKKTKDAVVLIVAQRISTIVHADKILVLDDGKIVGMGTHEELLKNNEVYQQIAASQLSKEELEGKIEGGAL